MIMENTNKWIEEKDLERFEQQIPISNTPKETRLYISPEFAEFLFTERNPNDKYAKSNGIKNRYFSKGHAVDIMKEMLANTFNSLNGSNSIVLNKEGWILDGQHRLWAMWHAHKGYTFVVAYGRDNSCMRTIDTNSKTRNNGDIATIALIPNARQVAAIIGTIERLRKDQLAISSNRRKNGTNSLTYVGIRTSSNYVLDYYDKHSELLQEAIKIARSYDRHRPKFIKQKELAGIIVFLILYKGHSKQKVVDFFQSVYYGEPNINAANALADFLYKDSQAVNSVVGSVKQGYITKAFNYYVDGKKI